MRISESCQYQQIIGKCWHWANIYIFDQYFKLAFLIFVFLQKSYIGATTLPINRYTHRFETSLIAMNCFCLWRLHTYAKPSTFMNISQGTSYILSLSSVFQITQFPELSGLTEYLSFCVIEKDGRTRGDFLARRNERTHVRGCRGVCVREARWGIICNITTRV